jgi:hypothetical protein
LGGVTPLKFMEISGYFNFVNVGVLWGTEKSSRDIPHLACFVAFGYRGNIS